MLDFIVKEFSNKSDRDLLHTILSNQHFIISKLSLIMGQFEDFTAALDKLDTDIQSVATELGSIVTGTPAGDLTADQAASLLARISGEQSKLEALAIPPAPAPTA